MKKIIWLSFLFVIGVLLVWCGEVSTDTNTDANPSSVSSSELPVQPERKMNLYGKVISMEGNEFTIQETDTTKDPTFDMSPEDKKAYMAKLSEEQRMALKEEIRNATLGNVKILIPVWVPVIVKTAQWPDAPSKLWSLEDLTVNSYISVRYNPEVTDQNVAEYVKKSWTN